MKKLIITDKNACQACLACEAACSTAFYKEFDPDKSCIRITAKPDGSPLPAASAHVPARAAQSSRTRREPIASIKSSAPAAASA